MSIALFVLFGCTEGKDDRSQSPTSPTTASSPALPASATVKITSTGTIGSGAKIGGVRVRLVLPKGVTVKATPDSRNTSVLVTDAGVVTTSGVATGANNIATYAATPSGVVLIHLAHSTGFGTGEFVTVLCDVAGGTLPKKDDFSVAEFKAVDLNGAWISGLTSELSVDIH